MPTVLLTGATGFLGQHLLRELVADGVSVRGLSRSDTGDAAIAAAGGVPVRGDVTDHASLQRAVQGVDAVFHTAADTSPWRREAERQTRINVDGTRALVAAAEAAGVRDFVHTSSVSAYSHLVPGTLREDVAQRGVESWINYERTKHLAEQAVRGSALPWLVFQPSHILGPGDKQNWSKLFVLIDRQKLPGAPSGYGTFADVREIARAQVRGSRQPARGEAFLLGGEHAAFADLIRRCAQALGRRAPRGTTPAWALHGYAWLQEQLAVLRGRAPDVTREGAALTSYDLRVDSGKAIRALGYRETPLDALLADTLAWMRGEGMLS